MTRIRTDGKIRENPSNPCHPCSLPGGDFYPVRPLFAAGARGEGAGFAGYEGAGGSIWIHLDYCFIRSKRHAIPLLKYQLP